MLVWPTGISPYPHTHVLNGEHACVLNAGRGVSICQTPVCVLNRVHVYVLNTRGISNFPILHTYTLDGRLVLQKLSGLASFIPFTASRVGQDNCCLGLEHADTVISLCASLFWLLHFLDYNCILHLPLEIIIFGLHTAVIHIEIVFYLDFLVCMHYLEDILADKPSCGRINTLPLLNAVLRPEIIIMLYSHIFYILGFTIFYCISLKF